MHTQAQTTEAATQTGLGMDQWPADQLSAYLCQAQMASLQCLETASQPLAEAGEAAVTRLQTGQGRLIYCGAGSAGAQACMDGMELPGTYGWPQARLAVLLAGGLECFLQDDGSAEDDTAAGVQAFHALQPKDADVLVAVSASGNTPYTVAIAQAARQTSTLVIGLCNNHGSSLQQCADYSIVLTTGAEAVAGSTRMAAGTAQKIALNTLSTLVMARLGYLYDNLMVNMRISNQKLIGRGAGMVARIGQCSTAQAEQCLQQAQGHIPLAVLLARGLELAAAHELLARHGNRLRAAMQALGQ